MQHLGITSLKKVEFLAAVNQRRTLLKLDPLADLTATTSIKEGVVADESKGPVKFRVIKATALSELASYQQHVFATGDTALQKNRQDAIEILTTLTGNPAALKSFRCKILIEQELELLDEDACPLCDTAWDMAVLKVHLEDKVAKAAEASAMLKKLSDAVQPVIDNLENVEISAKKVVQTCGNTEPKIDAAALNEFIAACGKDRLAIEKVCTDPEGIADALAALQRKGATPQPAAVAAATSLKTHLDALPAPSKEEAAKEFLIVAQERYDRCRTHESGSRGGC